MHDMEMSISQLFEKLFSQLSSVSIAGFGLGWQVKKAEFDIVSQRRTFLEGKRALFDIAYAHDKSTGHGGGGQYPHFRESVMQIRKRLDSDIETISRSSPLYSLLSSMRQACMEFLSTDERWVSEAARVYNPDHRGDVTINEVYDANMKRQKAMSTWREELLVGYCILIQKYELSTPENILDYLKDAVDFIEDNGIDNYWRRLPVKHKRPTRS